MGSIKLIPPAPQKKKCLKCLEYLGLLGVPEVMVRKTGDMG